MQRRTHHSRDYGLLRGFAWKGWIDQWMLTTLDAEELEELIYNDRNMHVKEEAKRRRVWLTNSLPREAFDTTCLEGKLA